MAQAQSATVSVKVVPDLSEFGPTLIQHLSLDDPLARAIVDAAPTDMRISAMVGDQPFLLHHWTITQVNGRSQLQTTWMGGHSDPLP